MIRFETKFYVDKAHNSYMFSKHDFEIVLNFYIKSHFRKAK